jgi:cytochrome c6
MKTPSRRRLRDRLTLVAVAGAFLLAGCGADDAPEVAPPDVTPGGDAEAGRAVFLETAQPSCGDCHALADAGTTGTVGVDLDERQPSHEEVVQAVRTGPDVMPPYDDQLTDEQIDDLAAYVSEASGAGG